jgi:hypothetical protein
LADSSILPCVAEGFGKSPPVNHLQLYQESLISLNRLKYSTKLFPIPLPNSATLKKWECLDSDPGEVLTAAVRKNHIPDFSNWQPPAAFARAFARREKALRTSTS